MSWAIVFAAALFQAASVQFWERRLHTIDANLWFAFERTSQIRWEAEFLRNRPHLFPEGSAGEWLLSVRYWQIEVLALRAARTAARGVLRQLGGVA